ncbi:MULTISPECIES: hypothetical protein [Arsenophonus]|uniref:hypothetical protein n=1 Tax=Arsenophonus TaxID=637 RepID=UPI001CDC3887|nr:hypothetical protein [Arsenophonus apicola]UBX27927.1 hypothetical protein LDL57_08520 [Arsenophonus apicola]UBX30214.1 hypothetical protein LDL57_06315 [Arsenophonus apicola]UBX30856.1 hypothetical protein LDL57_16670 [Arsenophonus apicola]
MNKNICQKPHRYNQLFTSLSNNQGQNSRHKCAGCAYELGRHHALTGAQKAYDDSVLTQISDSQAGAVRHKDAFESYNHGYQSVFKIA